MMASKGEQWHDCLFKVVLVGDCGVGKSSLIRRFTDDSFTENNRSTIGVDYKMINKEVDGRKAKLQIWDTAGTERFQSITSAYYNGAKGIVLVYDCSKRLTFDNIQRRWLREIESSRCDENAVKILLGNKCDLVTKRQVSFEEADKFAKSQNITYLETSAKDATNVNEAFVTMTSQMISELSQNYFVVEEDYQSFMIGGAVPVTDSWMDYLTSWCSIS